MTNIMIEDEKGRMLILKHDLDELDHDGIPVMKLIVKKKLDDISSIEITLSYEDACNLSKQIRKLHRTNY